MTLTITLLEKQQQPLFELVLRHFSERKNIKVENSPNIIEENK